MPRRVPPPDFRYVWLLPGPTPAALTLLGGIVAAFLLGVALWSFGQQPLTLGLTLAGAAVATRVLLRRERGLRIPFGAREVSMAVVPWGIIVTPDTEPRVLRWPSILRVDVAVEHTLRGGTPSTVSSVVTVRTKRGVFSGRAVGAVGLEALTANLEGYAVEASRPVAGDLDGNEAIGDGTIEAIVGEIDRRARELCASGDGAERLSLPPGGYREISSRSASLETVAALRVALRNVDAPADPRPLAAMIAASLGAKDLTNDLLRLCSSPHPITAAVAKAAALRLGARPERAGSIDEVQAFLLPEDHEALEAWVTG